MNQESLQGVPSTTHKDNADYVFSLKRVDPKQTGKLDVEVSLATSSDHELGYPRLGPVQCYLLNAFYAFKQDYVHILLT